MRFLPENAVPLYGHTGFQCFTSKLDAPTYSVWAGAPSGHSLPHELTALEETPLQRKQSPEWAKVGSSVPPSKPIGQLRRRGEADIVELVMRDRDIRRRVLLLLCPSLVRTKY